VASHAFHHFMVVALLVRCHAGTPVSHITPKERKGDIFSEPNASLSKLHMIGI
jgi:hypothetical protein